MGRMVKRLEEEITLETGFEEWAGGGELKGRMNEKVILSACSKEVRGERCASGNSEGELPPTGC